MIALDAGAVSAVERGHPTVTAWVERAVEDNVDVLLSVAALAEVWRAPPAVRVARLLKTCLVEPVDEALAKSSGAAVGEVGASTIDALVAASAARAGATLLTSDPEDMARLRGHFRDLRFVAV